MYEIMVTCHFDAAHFLPHYEGKCSKMHGHRWVVKVLIRNERLQQKGPHRGMVEDFSILKKGLANVLAELDHNVVNNVIPNPTAERIAWWIWSNLPYLAHRVEVWETPDSCAAYVPGTFTFAEADR